MDKKLIFPHKLLEDELFKEFIETSFQFSDPITGTFKDVSEKYSGSSELPQETIDEILKEFGLESLSDLLAVSPVIDKHNVLGFASAIASLKGSKVGYFLVLDLLNFSYTAVPWYEQTPRGEFNTFSFDVNLDASVIPAPYKTFQGIKKFTRDYLLSIISPLGYTYFVPFNGPALSMKCAAHPTYNAYAERLVDPALVYGQSGWIIQDENGQNWKIKVNGVGELKAFRTASPSRFISVYMKDPNSASTFRIVVTPDGEIQTTDIITNGGSERVELTDGNGNEWYVTIDSSGNLIVSN